MPRKFSDYTNNYATQVYTSREEQAEITSWLTAGGDPTQKYTGDSRVIAGFCKWACQYWVGVYTATVSAHRFFPFAHTFMEDYARTSDGSLHMAVGRDGRPSTRNQKLRVLLRALDALIPQSQDVSSIDWPVVIADAVERDENGSCLLTEAGMAAATSRRTRESNRQVLDSLAGQLLDYVRLPKNTTPKKGLNEGEPTPPPPAGDNTPKVSRCGRVFLPESGIAVFTTVVGGTSIPVTLDLSDPRAESAWAEEVHERDLKHGAALIDRIKYAALPDNPAKRAQVLAWLEAILPLMA